MTMFYRKKFFFVTITVFGLFYFLAIKIADKFEQKHNGNLVVGNRLPNFICTAFYAKLNEPSVVIAFQPDCEHCQYEAKNIKDKSAELRGVNIAFLTSASDSLAKKFADDYGLNTQLSVRVFGNQKILLDSLGVKTIPTVFIYNKDKQLVKRFDGETKIEAILKYISPEYSSVVK
jgi:thiol-disulfide isomerase/thioredoxin